MDPEKLKAILDRPQPEGLKAIQRFLGFANFYRQFIKNYCSGSYHGTHQARCEGFCLAS